jgi:hypothetical protein
VAFHSERCIQRLHLALPGYVAPARRDDTSQTPTIWRQDDETVQEWKQKVREVATLNKNQTNHVRQMDFDFWMSQQAKDIVKQEGIILLDYRALQVVWRG